MNKVVIISQQGSGTNLLRSFLNSHPNVAIYDEIFTRSDLFRDFKNEIKGKEQFEGEAVYNYLDYFFNHPHSFYKDYQVHTVEKPEMKENASVIGFDLKYDNIEANPKIVDYLKEHPDIKIIQLHRDVARTFLRRVNEYSERTFTYDEFMQYIEWYNNWHKYIYWNFTESKLFYLTYEEITRGREIQSMPDSVDNDILDFLDVSHKELTQSGWFVRGDKLSMRYK